jgi:transposase-like protein
VIYVDGQCFGGQHVIGVVGVDTEGYKHVLTIESGTTENAAAVKRALSRLRDQGRAMDRKYLFVIDGAKACARPSRRCLAPSSRCSAAAITR